MEKVEEALKHLAEEGYISTGDDAHAESEEPEVVAEPEAAAEVEPAEDTAGELVEELFEAEETATEERPSKGPEIAAFGCCVAVGSTSSPHTEIASETRSSL